MGGCAVKKEETVDRKKNVDTGMALVLICLILFFFLHRIELLYGAIGLLLAAMTVPTVLKPFAFLWFKLSAILGAVMSRVVLGVVYYALVCPIGFLRQLGKDSLTGKKAWKRSVASVLIDRDHHYKFEDINHPF